MVDEQMIGMVVVIRKAVLLLMWKGMWSMAVSLEVGTDMLLSLVQYH